MAVVVQLQGLTPYANAHLLQRELLERRIADALPDVILLLEHAPAVTVGRARGAMDNVHIPEGDDTPVYRVERGGDVTWHGPGQLVAYPIVKLEGDRRDLRRHLTSLEDAVIGLLSDQGLHPTRDARNTGVWLPNVPAAPQKVCSIGVAARRWVTWHGLALNVSTTPKAFDLINPCGFSSNVMTRLADHLRLVPSVASLGAALGPHLLSTLDLPLDDPAAHTRVRHVIAKVGLLLPAAPAPVPKEAP